MKLPLIQESIAAVAAFNGKPLAIARANARKARVAEEAAREAFTRIGWPHVSRLRRAMANALRPHRIEWDNHNTGITPGEDAKSRIWLRGVISPATTGPRFATSLRVTLPFDMHPKSAEQFAAQVAALKAGADAIQAQGY